MTSTINALMQSGPPEQKSRITKTESPSRQDGSDNRFKDSLEKAMNGNEEKEAAKSGEKSEATAVADKKEVSDVKKKSESADGEKKLSSEKTLNFPRGDKKPVLKIKGEKSGEEDSEDVSNESVSQLIDNESIKKRLSTARANDSENSRRIVKKDEKPSGGAVKDRSPEQIVSGNPLETEHVVDDKLKSLMPEKERKISDSEEKGAESVIIPFPKAGDSKTAEMASAQNQASEKFVSTAKEPASRLKKGKDEPVLTVIDTRSKGAENRETAQGLTKASASVETTDQTSKESNQIVLGEQAADKASGEETRSFQSRFTENREVVLARELRESGNEQIVRKASFILKDSNQGEIRLILKPEALGQVKIHLDMNENNLVGKIIVENHRVGQIFENNLSNLSKAFEEAGISSSSIEVTVGDGNGRNGGNQASREDQPFFSERLKTLDKAVPSVERMASGLGTQHINLVI
ncbi:MAG: flagellar hook-length control protein FliK [Spirochaetales bacterium]|nr:flagellar hook-length control protein FliK [Spirochaetales bacterium]